MHTLHWVSERRGQDWTPLENDAFNTIPDDWGQLDEAQRDNLVGREGKSDEAKGGNSGNLDANHGNSGISPPVNTQADSPWNASADAGQSRQMVINQQHVDNSKNKTPDTGPSKNFITQEGTAINWSQVAMVVPSKKTVATKALASKSKARGPPGWGSNNSHPHYEADEYVWGEEGDVLWSRHTIDTGPIIRTRAGNKGRSKRGGSH